MGEENGKKRARPGQPTKYRREYNDQVIEFMSYGFSLTAFAGSIGVSRETISEWMRQHPEFSASTKIAKAKCAQWWENTNRKNALEGGGNATSSIFGLKNMAPDEWREQQEHKLTGPNGGPVQVQPSIDPNQLDDATLQRLLEAKQTKQIEN